MKFNESHEIKVFMSFYEAEARGHPLMIAKNVVSTVESVLQITNDLVFFNRCDISKAHIIAFLKLCSYEKGSKKFKRAASALQEKLKPWRRDPDVQLLWSCFLIRLNRFMWGDWDSVENQVHTSQGTFVRDGETIQRGFDVPEKHRAPLIGMTHRLTNAYIQDVMARLKASSCILDPDVYDEKKAYHHILEQEQMQREHDPLKLAPGSWWNQLSDGLHKAVSSLLFQEHDLLEDKTKQLIQSIRQLTDILLPYTHYQKRPNLYACIIRLLDLTKLPCDHKLQEKITSLLGILGSDLSSEDTRMIIYLINRVQRLRQEGYESDLNQHGPIDHEVMKKRCAQHIEELLNRWDSQCKLAIDKWQHGQLRYMALSAYEAPEIKAELERFKQSVSRGDYNREVSNNASSELAQRNIYFPSMKRKREEIEIPVRKPMSFPSQSL